jgi:hypothetical protein
MASDAERAATEETIEVDLRNPVLAAIWAWMWPGAGHLYQRRYAKGILFMICVLSTYFFGLTLGGGHVVYAAWSKGDRRWQYLCQIGVGTPAVPALIQSHRVKNGQEPLFDGIMAPPKDISPTPDRPDDLSDLHLKYHSFFEMGTLYTMIAGLLNILAIYDAFAGPVILMPEEEEETDRPPPDGKRKRKVA